MTLSAIMAAREANINGPVPAFDHQLKTLSDSYISFLSERVRIEETYIDSLARLHRNTRALDDLLDDRDPSTVRKAWRELRDNVEREAEARTAFANTLRNSILPPLHTLRETQERTRKRIKEDLKESTAAHQDYAENVLPRLKRGYLKKCQEVDEYRTFDKPGSTSSSQTHPSVPLAAPIPRRASFEEKSSTFKDPSLSGLISPPPYPVHPPGSRNRSPSAAGGKQLSDLAHQGKKGLNQLMGFLDQGRDKEKSAPSGSLKEGTDRASNGLRGVRAKRECDEADKEYRKGVHWLETLRLRRVKILQAGYNSLEQFVSEAGDIMRKALTIYVDAVSSTASTCNSLAEYGQSTLKQIDTSSDLDRVHNFVQYAFARAAPPEVYYFNYHVGECKDLIFGVSLVDYATTRNRPNEPPSIVTKAINQIEAKGMDSEGIYRVSGRHAALQELTHQIEKNEHVFEFNAATTEDVYAVSGMLKLYLRELPEPVFRLPLTDRLHHTEGREEHQRNGFPLLRSKIRRLPPVHQATLRALLEHLNRVSKHSATNKMDVRNLAIVFGAVIFGEDELPKTGDVLAIAAFKDTVMEDLISNTSTIFEDLQVKKPSPISVKSITPPSVNQTLVEPALPVPPEESPTSVDYGSNFTKIVTLPPRNSTSREQDFTPTVPTRPTPSIHPSRRTNTTTSINSESSTTSASDRSPAAASFTHEPEEIALPTSATQEGSPLSDYASAYASAMNSPPISRENTDPILRTTSVAENGSGSSSDSTMSTTSTVVPESEK